MSAAARRPLRRAVLTPICEGAPVARARDRVHTNWLRDRLLAEYTIAAASPSELARKIGQPSNLVHYHTRVLLEHGFLELVRTERRRGGTAHVYRARTGSMIEDDEWSELSPQTRRMLIRSVLNAVLDESRSAALSGGFDAATAHLSRWPVHLDEQARTDVSRLLHRVLDDLVAIQAAADQRACGSRRRVDVVLMGFTSRE